MYTLILRTAVPWDSSHLLLGSKLPYTLAWDIHQFVCGHGRSLDRAPGAVILLRGIYWGSPVWWSPLARGLHRRWWPFGHLRTPRELRVTLLPFLLHFFCRAVGASWAQGKVSRKLLMFSLHSTHLLQSIWYLLLDSYLQSLFQVFSVDFLSGKRGLILLPLCHLPHPPGGSTSFLCGDYIPWIHATFSLRSVLSLMLYGFYISSPLFSNYPCILFFVFHSQCGQCYTQPLNTWTDIDLMLFYSVSFSGESSCSKCGI